MAEFEEAYHKNTKQFIKVENYSDKIHYMNIFCPECEIAPIHIVRKQKGTYFASNRKDEHSEDCQHYREFIVNKNIVKLINSEISEDKERLRFLIDSNLRSSLNLLQKKVIGNLDFLKINRVHQIESNFETSKLDKYTTENILRIHIKNIFKKKAELLNQYIIIYGFASIECTERESVNKTTQESFKIKNMYFKLNDRLHFSITLTGKKLNHYVELSENPFELGFAVFGLMAENKGYLNLKISSINHLKILT
ncbi:hypothetical protein [Flavobacterium columnare]|uniref:hypothetical protein n=1 Tax=Flavobacterium columnare TaxID=996 RepID=UPI003B9EED80